VFFTGELNTVLASTEVASKLEQLSAITDPIHHDVLEAISDDLQVFGVCGNSPLRRDSAQILLKC
jgi:hypothetical protein